MWREGERGEGTINAKTSLQTRMSSSVVSPDILPFQKACGNGVRKLIVRNSVLLLQVILQVVYNVESRLKTSPPGASTERWKRKRFSSVINGIYKLFFLAKSKWLLVLNCK